MPKYTVQVAFSGGKEKKLFLPGEEAEFTASRAEKINATVHGALELVDGKSPKTPEETPEEKK